MLARRDYLGWVTNGDAADRHGLTRRQYRLDLNDPVNAHLGVGARSTAGEERSARGQGAATVHLRPVQVCMGSY